MNYRAVGKNLGIVLLCQAGFLLPAWLLALFYQEGDAGAFLITIIALLLAGVPLCLLRPAQKKLFARDGMAIVALGWLAMSIFGALPFFLSGAIPSWTAAFFEAVSGFTTTGATILPAVEGLPHGILFWRSLTHWLGGMGVLVLTLAILPSAGAVYILRAESPGPAPDKLVPRMAQTAKLLYGIYLALTLLLVVLLLLAGMPLFDAFIHAFGTAGTGGFSSKNASIGAYASLPIELITAIFMLVFGISFTIHYQLVRKNWRHALADEELRLYLGLVAAAVLLISYDLWRQQLLSLPAALRHAFFQVSSLITTTGYATKDFNNWPVFSKGILVVLMFIGASAGSTGGGLKVIRILLLFKLIRRDLQRNKHPRLVRGILVNKRPVEQPLLEAAMIYILFYLLIFALATLLLANQTNDLVTASTAVLSCLSNIGPGLGDVGPAGSFAFFNPFAKIVLSVCMLLGRLEIMPVILLSMPSFWRRVGI